MIVISLFNNSFSEDVLLPEYWNDFSIEELERLALTLKTNGSSVEFLLFVLQNRIHMAGLQLPPEFIAKLNAEDVGAELLPVVDIWLKENNLTKNPYPELDNYFGPADDFNDMTCGEFEAAEVSYLLSATENNSEKVAELASILWRPNTEKGRRKPYDSEDTTSSFFNDTNPVKLQVIWFWYMGCRANLSNLFPRLFPKSGGNANAQPDLTAVTKMIHSGAGGRNGSRKDIRAMLLKEFLFDIQLQMQDYEEMESKMKMQG